MNLEAIAAEVVGRTTMVSTAAAPLPPNDRVAARFSEVMSASPSTPSTPVPPPDVPRVDSETVRTPGETILSGLQKVSTEFQESWSSARAALDGRVDLQDMLKLQMELVQTSVRYELMGKAIFRSTQNLEHLVKTQ